MTGIKGSSELSAETLDDSELQNETESLTPEEGVDQESDTGKLKQLLGVLRKVVGVKVTDASTQWQVDESDFACQFHASAVAGPRQFAIESASQSP